MPNGHFHVIFSESKFYAIYNGENHFQISGLVAVIYVFEYGVRHSALWGKLALIVEDVYVKTIGWILKSCFDHETRQSGLFPCYRLKINDF